MSYKRLVEEIDLDASLDDDDTPMPDRDLVATMEEGDVPISFEDDIEDEMSIEDIDDEFILYLLEQFLLGLIEE